VITYLDKNEALAIIDLTVSRIFYFFYNGMNLIKTLQRIFYVLKISVNVPNHLDLNSFFSIIYLPSSINESNTFKMFLTL